MHCLTSNTPHSLTDTTTLVLHDNNKFASSAVMHASPVYGQSICQLQLLQQQRHPQLRLSLSWRHLWQQLQWQQHLQPPCILGAPRQAPYTQPSLGVGWQRVPRSTAPWVEVEVGCKAPRTPPLPAERTDSSVKDCCCVSGMLPFERRTASCKV